MTALLDETHLEPRLVGDVEGHFYVPAYQRGYRWGPIEVERLLDDIWENRDRPYYLQPVVVKRHGSEWELVDGQQRLTTLFLLMQYMKKSGLQNAAANWTMRYETRVESAAYLEDLDPARSQDNIDFFHIHAAYRCIGEWFDRHGSQGRQQHVANKVFSALFESVRVIWYEAPEDTDATTLFTRLNVGRIPLTDAELVKALLLSRSRQGTSGHDRALETAAQWDAVERDLRDPEVWAFATGRATPEPTHISLLLDTLAGGPVGRERPLFHTFETLRGQITEGPEAFWEKVVDLHSLVLGWYEDRDLFHKIGYLIATGRSFASLLERSRGQSKSRFQAELDDLVRSDLAMTETDLRDLAYQSPRTGRALLLMNVETVRTRRRSTERYSFREHAAGRWSLEHIHAQNAEQLNRVEQWSEWLRLHRRALLAADWVDDAIKTATVQRVDDALGKELLRQADFRPLERELTRLLSPGGGTADGDVDSIGNLALLSSEDNSALSNSVFAVKREEVLRRDRCGSYVPVCTRHAFMKYYTPASEQQVHFWSMADRRHYVDALVAALTPYLSAEPAAA